jgi:hypothetical protein
MISRRHFAFAAAAAVVTGCTTLNPLNQDAGPRYQPTNVYLAVRKLPENLRRTAILPLHFDGQPPAEESRALLQNTLRDEAIATRKFEVIPVPAEQLRRWIGQASLLPEGPMPPDLLRKLRDEAGCDAVMLGRIPSYRPYAPVAIAVDLKLVRTETGQILWGVDELFDSARGDVARAARDFFKAEHGGPSEMADPQADLRSARLFSRYVFRSALATMPAR